MVELLENTRREEGRKSSKGNQQKWNQKGSFLFGRRKRTCASCFKMANENL